MRRAAVIAAMAGELKPLTRGWKRAESGGCALWTLRSGETEWTAACAGAGAQAAQRAFSEAERGGALHAVVSAGWAGALDADLRPGGAHRVAEVIDPATGERFQAADPPQTAGEKRPGLRLVSAPRVADLDEKRRLRRAHGADLVDMEAAAVARLARGRGIPFYCVKGVSDGADERLPDLNRFLSPDGRFRTGRFALHAALRPRLWGGLIRLGADSGRAAKGMAVLLEAMIREFQPAPAPRPR